MTIGVYASMPHYKLWAETLAAASGLDWEPIERDQLHLWDDGPILVASYIDSQKLDPNRHTIWLTEHGVGQSYLHINGGRYMSYAGGRGRTHVDLYLPPGEYAAGLERATRPRAKIVKVGLPILDGMVAERDGGPVFVWHWACGACLESGSAWDDWAKVVLPLADRWPGAAMHAHPRNLAVRKAATAAGWRWVDTWQEVVQHASVVIWDNTTVGYLAALLDISTVLLNGARWRWDVHHGLRFYEALPGPLLLPGNDLVQAIDDTLSGVLEADWADVRQAVRPQVCAPDDGWQQAMADLAH